MKNMFSTRRIRTKIDQSVSRKFPKPYICVADKNQDEAIHEAYIQITKCNIHSKSSIQNNPLSRNSSWHTNRTPSSPGQEQTSCFSSQTVSKGKMSSLSQTLTVIRQHFILARYFCRAHKAFNGITEVPMSLSWPDWWRGACCGGGVCSGSSHSSRSCERHCPHSLQSKAACVAELQLYWQESERCFAKNTVKIRVAAWVCSTMKPIGTTGKALQNLTLILE